MDRPIDQSASSTVAAAATKPAAACFHAKSLNPKKFHHHRVNEPSVTHHPCQPQQTTISSLDTAPSENRRSAAALPSAKNRQQLRRGRSEEVRTNAHLGVATRIRARGNTAQSLGDAMAGRDWPERRKVREKERRQIFACRRAGEGPGRRGNAAFSVRPGFPRPAPAAKAAGQGRVRGCPTKTPSRLRMGRLTQRQEKRARN